jgi:hypothetical protein
VRDFEATKNLNQFLGELSFSGYQEMGCSNILLVEGKTDVKTLHQLLRKFRKEQKWVLLSLGGDALISKSSGEELRDICRISKNIHVVIDSERKAQGETLATNRQEFQSLCKSLNIECLVLQRRAIENYFTDEAIKTAKGSGYRALEPYESLVLCFTLLV